MARVTFSALISAASGSIGDVVMSRWKGIAYARRRVTPSNPQSGDQMLQRHVLKMALTLWQSVKSWTNPPWILAASGYALSGYNQFMNYCMAALQPQYVAAGVGEDPVLTTEAVTVLTPHNSAYAALISPSAGTPAGTQVTFTWTARAGADATNKVRGLYRLDDTFVWSEETEVLESAETIVFTPLTNDLQYEFALVPYNNSSDLYGQSSHALQTPAA